MFGNCCQVFRASRPFVRSPGGGFAPAMIYTERWTGVSFADVRAALMASEHLWCTEDTLLRSFWHYRPGGGSSQEVFGSIALTPSELELNTLSQPRYTMLRSVLEEALGPLPVGDRQVKALVSGTADGESAGKGEGSGERVSPARPLLEEYASIRARLRTLNESAIKELTREEIAEAARRLRLLDRTGRLAFDGEHDLGLLMDFALHEEKRHGQPVITHFMRKHPVTDTEGTCLYRAFEQSWVSLFSVGRVTPEGLVVHDLSDARSPDYLLVDIGLIHSAEPGMGLVARLLPMPRFAMLSGWGFAVQAGQVEQVLREYRRIWQTESRRARLSTLIRYCRNSLPSLVVGERTV